MKKILFIIFILLVSPIFACSAKYFYFSGQGGNINANLKEIKIEPQSPRMEEMFSINLDIQLESDNINLAPAIARVRVNFGDDPNWDADPNNKLWDHNVGNYIVGDGGHFHYQSEYMYFDTNNHVVTIEICAAMNVAASYDDPTMAFCDNFTTTVITRQIGTPKPQEEKDWNPLTCDALGDCFNLIATILFYVSIAGVSASILAAGFLFLTVGTPARIALAKKILLWGIGLFVIMLLVKFIAIVSRVYLNS